VKPVAFELQFEPLDANLPEYGRLALVPWDSETFGFRIADLDIDPARMPLDGRKFSRALESWTQDNDVQLVGASVSASALPQIDFLQAAGFRFLDITLRVNYPRLQSATLAPSMIELRRGRAADVPAVLAIAGSAFSHGRYHADSNIDRDRANQRYRDWVHRAASSGGPQELYVAVCDDEIRAFALIEMSGQAGRFHLLGVSPEWQGSPLGLHAMAATLRTFQSLGATAVESKISAANTSALNLHAYLGAQFHSPAALLHRHFIVRR
jgi:GNAT superfamily N-acetyltransferase